MSNSSEQCTLDVNRKLKPAKSINFFFDKDDTIPITGPDAALSKTKTQTRWANTGSQMKEFLDAEKRKTASMNDTLDDSDFSASSDSETATDVEISEPDITNKELADVLVSKAIPWKCVTVEEVENDEDTAPTSQVKKAHCNIVDEDSGNDGDASPLSKSSATTGNTQKTCKGSEVHRKN
ncbi:uncharacterized protein EV420DRAFT_1487803 [Desarmillaria tabescens]|uniref:Uncharacterized protein n=1 Tax=Armillaria tabescens TaxID=1929756 RepID=A0AA39J4D5_ARMTA|nr:uncharacterized protein EV420DRAFT_1487803 [Desarmillaria tabescens]KAK0435922.1 hypothetical protein EV420DRAFT_1487803 [Desarmillaria tabescens]